MSPLNFTLAVLQHTPVWVWALLALLLALGARQAVPRSVTLRRARMLPLSMLALSLWGVVSVFGSPLALAAWAAGGIVAATLSQRAGCPPGALWSASEQTFSLPGSWVPMLLILAIFSTKFGVGVSLAQHPDWRLATGFAVSVSLAYGVFSGVFAGRALALWRLSHARPANTVT